MATGDQPSTWGTTTNSNFSIIDEALDGVYSVTLTSGSYTLQFTEGTTSAGLNRIIVFSGSYGGTVSIVIAPSNLTKWYWIVNSSNSTLTISNGSGATVSVPVSTQVPIFCYSGGVESMSSGINATTSLTTPNLSATSSAQLPAAGSVTVNGTPLNTYINSLIPTLTSMPGTLVLSSIVTVGVSGGTWVLFVFGTVSGTRVVIGYGTGSGSSGSGVVLPSGYGFSYTNSNISAKLSAVDATSGNLLGYTLAYNSSTGVFTFSGSQSGGGSPTSTIGWDGVIWATGY